MSNIIDIPTEFDLVTNKEILLINAVRNLIRKNNMIELRISLKNKIITQDDYELEINKNSDLYFFKLNESTPKYVILLAISLIKQLNFDHYTEREIAELFSIKPEEFIPIYRKEITKI